MKKTLLAFTCVIFCMGLLMAQGNSLYLSFDDEGDLTACGTLADDAEITAADDEFDEGMSGMAFAPTGENYITIDLGGSFNFNEFTIAFWFNRTSNVNRGMLVAMNDYNYGWDEESTGGMIMNLEDDFGYAEAQGKVTLVLNDDSEEGEAYLYEDWADLSGEDGNWHHLALTFNKADEEAFAYMDGEVVDIGWLEFIGSGDVVWNTLTLCNVPDGDHSGDGEPPTSDSYGIIGLMDEFVLYDEFLEDSDIADLYDNDGVPEEFDGCVSGVSRSFRPDQFFVMPNPANDFIQIQIDGEITLYNTLGQKVSQHSTYEKGRSIDVRNLERGLYFVWMESRAGLHIEKLILK